MLALIFFLIGLGVSAEDTTTIYDFRYYEAPEHTRIVLDLGQNYQHTLDKKNNKLILKIKHAKLLTRTFNNVFYRDKRILKTSLNRKDNYFYIYYHLKKNYDYKTLHLKPNKKYPHYRLVIDIIDKSTAKVISPLGKKIIVIDAGHGGEDAGAVGHNKHLEKDIVLNIAKKLQQIINNNKKLIAVLTRESDYFIKLTERPRFAQKNNADLFISIHADSALRKSARGASVYVLSKKGGSTALAKQLEKSENATDIFDDAQDIIENDKILSQNVWQLASQNSKKESQKFAEILLQHLSKVTKLHKKEPQNANFVVLKTPAIASVLLESGFISNINDEQQLISGSYQNKIAQALYDAVVEYFE